MADDDVKGESVADPELAVGKRGPVLELAASDPELDDPPSMASVDDLLGETESGVDSAPPSEDNEPLALPRNAMLRSAFPPPLPGSKKPGGERSHPPPLPGTAGPPAVVAPPPRPSGPPPAQLGRLPVVTAPPLSPNAVGPASIPPPPRAPSGPPPLPSTAKGATPARSRGSTPPPLPQWVSRGPAIELLTARISWLEGSGDRVQLGRALAELAVMRELTLDDAASVSAARASLAADPSSSAMHALLRRKEREPGTSTARLAHVDEELQLASEGPLRVSLLAERARLLAADGRVAEALAAWSQVLAHEPLHAAALRGKEAALAESDQGTLAVVAAWADHLAVMADAILADPTAAAWLLVERAALLEERLGDVTGARRALDRALTLAPGKGPARRALLRHVSKHRDASALVELLAEEGRLEADAVRGARLELEAASVAEHALGDRAQAIALLERAAKRGTTRASVDERVLVDLIRLLCAVGRARDARPWRHARLLVLGESTLRAEELRALARSDEEAGELDTAIGALEQSLTEEADAATLAQLDRLLAESGRHEPRIALWVTDAARAVDGGARVRALLQAADIAERTLGRRDEAIRHLRTAWSTEPGHPEVLQALARLLTRPTKDTDARTRLELYAQAAERATDPGRKVTYLEQVALLAEDVLGDHERAVLAYHAVLRLEPDRLGAMLGLGRSAAAAKDAAGLHASLMAQARVARNETEALALRVQAAVALASLDPARALAVASDVLRDDPTQPDARALVTRLYEANGQWELVARSVEQHLAHASDGQRHALLLYLAEVQELHLKEPALALNTLRSAREGRAGDARLGGRIARVLSSIGEPAALRDAFEALAGMALDDAERANYLVRAAELSEHRLGDDAGAHKLYEAARAACPGEAVIEDRLERLASRRKEESPREPLDQALLLVTNGEDPARATVLLGALVDGHTERFAALRLAERVHRSAQQWAELADVLAHQADALSAPLPKLGALWAVADLEDRAGLPKDPRGTYARIVLLAPDDADALAAIVRLRLPEAVAGGSEARRDVIGALRRESVFETGQARALLELTLAYLLDQDDAEGVEAREALDRYRRVLSLDPGAVTAAWSLRRLAHRLGQTSAAVQATSVLAELAREPKAQARFFLEAAELLIQAAEASPPADAAAVAGRAAGFLERALAADPDSMVAATQLTRLRSGRDEPEALALPLRAALERAQDREAVVYLGTEVARIARETLHDLGVATAAMLRVRAVAPEHAPSLLTLAELYLAQRAWPEAVVALEAVVTHAPDPEPRLTALFALASIYEKVLARPDEHERVLRAALAIEPENPRALRALVEQLRKGGPAPATADEVIALLARLARAETDPVRKADAYLDSADLEAVAGDRAGTERSLIRAVVACPGHARAFARLAAFFRGPTGLDAAAYASSLQSLIARGREAGQADARWFAALGQLEIETLQRLHDGVAHLEWAVQLDPLLYETRFELADAYAKTGAKDQAIATLLALLIPDSRPLLALADAGVALALLDRLLEQGQRAEEAVVVSELRSAFGDIDPGREEWLQARRLTPLEEQHSPLGRRAFVEEVLPPPGRHVLLEVAAAAAGLEGKVLRTNLGELSLGNRDRIGARSGHPLRVTFDRATAALGVSEVELAVSPIVDRVRVVFQDVPWVVVPSTFEALPASVQVAAFARASARVLLGVPWLKELREPSVVAWLLAVARQITPEYGSDVRASSPELQNFEPLVARAIGRRQRKLLEPLAGHLQSREGRPPELAAFLQALEQGTTRAAYLVSGDLTATARALAIEDVPLRESLNRPGISALSALLVHPVLGDVTRFALTREAASLRRGLGSGWAR